MGSDRARSAGASPGVGSTPVGEVTASDLRMIMRDGIAFSIMMGLGETLFPAFAVAVGLSDLAAALVSTLPMLAGALLQLVTPWGVGWLRSHRRWVVACARVQALSFLPLLGGLALGAVPWPLLFGAASLYWAAGLGAAPPWNTWLEDLVPKPIRPRFLARRSRACQATLLASLLAAGGVLDVGERWEIPTLAFGALFAAAATARLVSSHYLRRHSEPRPVRQDALQVHPILFVRRLGEGQGRLFTHLLLMQLAVHVSAPFFAPYILGPLELDYAEFTLVVATAFASRIASLPLLGRIAERRGSGFLLWLGALGIIPLPLLWLYPGPLAYLLALQVLGGAAWASFELATAMAFFESIAVQERTSVLSLFNLANALAIAVGSGLGAGLYLGLEASPLLWVGIFVASACIRLLAVVPLRGVDTAAFPSDPVELRDIAARPSSGAIDRPVLASLTDDDPSGTGDPRG